MNSFSAFSACVSFCSYALIWSSMKRRAVSESLRLLPRFDSTKIVSSDCTTLRADSGFELRNAIV